MAEDDSQQNDRSQEEIQTSLENPVTDETVSRHTHSLKRSQGFRLIINILVVIMVVLISMAAWDRITNRNENTIIDNNPIVQESEENSELTSGGVISSEPDESTLKLISLSSDYQENIPVGIGIRRKAQPLTMIPSRPRVDVITYTVQAGDSLFSIADKYGVKPETVLWGNFEVLEDNPHLLSKGQILNILPVDGTYYQWNEGDNLQQIASFFGVESGAILNYVGNKIDLTSANAGNPGIEAGSWLIIPEGKRAIKDWGPPAISRSNPASAKYYGAGHCGSVYEGAVGNGTFVWPTPARSISGYGYSGIHPAIDIAGETGNAIFATDSGVIVFAGWSNYGYGYMIVVDHGNGWQSAYAHLSAVAVTCGQSVYQGGYIGALGSTGNSSGPHLHFELVYNGAKPNPLDYLQ